MNRLNIPLREPVQAWAAIRDAWQWAKPLLVAGHRLVLLLRMENRSDAQNRLLHSRLNDVTRQCKWAGTHWDIEEWKRLLTAAWCRTRNESVRVVPALDGQGFDVLYQHTSQLSRAECADLSEYVMAWGTDQGVEWCAASLALDWPEPVRKSKREVVDADGVITEVTA